MTTNKEYIELSKQSGIQVGDYVKVLRKAKDEEEGWNNDWVPNMDHMTGETYKVILEDTGLGFGIKKPNWPSTYSFPYFVLQKIDTEVQTVTKTTKPECINCTNWRLLDFFCSIGETEASEKCFKAAK
jgi:hypothetical protein